MSLEACKDIISLHFEGMGMKTSAAVHLMIACVERIKRV